MPTLSWLTRERDVKATPGSPQAAHNRRARSSRTDYKFTKDFLPDVPAFDGKDDREEFKAGQMIDSTSQIEFWVRNVARHANTFWLPLADGRTYPGSVARQKNGRTLVVEYKGGHLVGDAAEKRLIGELWEKASEGQGLYVFAEKERDGRNVRDQIRAAL